MELLVQVSVDPVRPTTHPVGDVIWHAPDGHVWGMFEVNHPNWRIVRVPGMSIHEAESLCSPQIPTKRGQKNLHDRGMAVDVAGLGLAATPRDPVRGKLSHVEFIVEHSTFRDASSVKPPG